MDTMVYRYITSEAKDSLRPGAVLGIFGPRRSGKTTLLKTLTDEIEKKSSKVLVVHGENLDASEALSSHRTSTLSRFIGDHKYLFIDEAQKIPNIGSNLKLIVDTLPDVSILVTGSSSFDLKNKIGEPLVGRSKYIHLYPFSLMEVADGNLEDQLIYGFYPQVYLEKTILGKREQLESIRDGYLLKDILELDNLKNSLFIFNLLRQIAFQIGQDVSYSELATNLGVNKKTVVRYLELLEKSFVIFSLNGFSRNLRKEYTKSPRYYFWDNGIRNSVISNYNATNIRDDIGALWENFCISERLKRGQAKKDFSNKFFWRTYDQKEIDLVEEKNGKLFAFECKYTKGLKQTKIPKDFKINYPNSKFVVINKNNYFDYLT